MLTRRRLINNTLRPKQDGRHFADDIFTCIFFIENCCILIKFSLKYVRKGPIDNNRALVQIMAWRRSGDKPVSEAIMISLPTHICVTWPQWVETNDPVMEIKRFPYYCPFVMGYHRSSMMTSLNGNIFRVTGPLWGESTGHHRDSPHIGQWRGTYFDLHLDKRLIKQSVRRWFEMPSRSWWCHCNAVDCPQ